MADGELVLRIKRVITSRLELLQKVLNVACLVIEVGVGDDAGIRRMQMRRVVRREERTCVRIECSSACQVLLPIIHDTYRDVGHLDLILLYGVRTGVVQQQQNFTALAL